MAEQPSGTVTLVFTDIEGSTRLMHALGESQYRAALGEHRRIVRSAFTRNGGYEVDYEGDSFFYTFQTADDAIAAVVEAQQGLADGPVTIRVGVHTGSPQLDPPKYVGMAVHQTARIMSAAHGGQVLLSGATRELLNAEVAVSDLGQHRLKDIAGPVHLFQLGSDTFPPPKSIAASNLPTPVTPLLGRDEQLDDATRRLDATRLLTITGPGGTGKTRFAVELATRSRRQFPDGVVWVALDAVPDSAAVSDTIANTMGAKVPPAEHVGDKRILLVLDNFEQVVDAAPAVAQLVAACPYLRVVVTSRELLRVVGESELPLPPLAIDPAVELFCDRAGIGPTSVIAELCEKLDRLPLALELAATRARILRPEELLDRLGQRLDLLKGRRDADPRQQTLRATIEWSHDLLTDEERALFAALGVFVGGFTLPAAEEICDADLDVLQSLHDKSLVTADAGRFAMLETIREFARERFDRLPTAAEITRRHAEWYADLAAEGKPALEGTMEQRRWLAILTAELGNIRAALAWSRDAEPTIMLGLTSRLGIFFWLAGYPAEALGWIEEALAACAGLGDEVDAARADTREFGAWLATFLGQTDRAAAHAESCAELHRKHGNDRGLGRALRELAKVTSDRGEKALARSQLEEAALLSRRASDDWNLAIALNNLGDLALSESNFKDALQLCGESLELRRPRGDLWGSAICQLNLGFASMGLEQYDEARRAFAASLELADEVGPMVLVAESLVMLAAVDVERDPQRAAYLIGASEVVFSRTDEVLQKWEAELLERTIAGARTRLTAEEFEVAADRGRNADRAEVLRVATAIESPQQR